MRLDGRPGPGCPDYGSEGWGFESLRARRSPSSKVLILGYNVSLNKEAPCPGLSNAGGRPISDPGYLGETANPVSTKRTCPTPWSVAGSLWTVTLPPTSLTPRLPSLA